MGSEYSDDDVLTFTPDLGFVGGDTVTLYMVYPWGSQATQEVILTWDTRLYLPLVLREPEGVVAREYP